jgi:hypothetical protein
MRRDFEELCMQVAFPSVDFFAALRAVMGQEAERFRRLGYFDTSFGIEVRGPSPRRFVLSFEVFDCTGVREVRDFEGEPVDFILAGDLAVWRDMLENIRLHDGADVAHSINTLSHFGEGLQVLYDDPDGHDKLYRFAESVQAFFDLSARLEIAGIAPPTRAAESYV